MMQKLYGRVLKDKDRLVALDPEVQRVVLKVAHYVQLYGSELWVDEELTGPAFCIMTGGISSAVMGLSDPVLELLAKAHDNFWSEPKRVDINWDNELLSEYLQTCRKRAEKIGGILGWSGTLNYIRPDKLTKTPESDLPEMPQEFRWLIKSGGDRRNILMESMRRLRWLSDLLDYDEAAMAIINKLGE